MTESDSTKLRFGPYAMPSGYCVGDSIECSYRGRDVVIAGITDAPVQWLNARKTGKPWLILCGDLIRAVETESETAVCHHWRVNKTTVWQWRRTLNVKRMTSGTKEVFRTLFIERLTPDDIERGRRKARSKKSRAKMIASKTGQPIHKNSRKALLAAVKRPKTQAHREALSRAHVALGTRPPGGGRPWTKAEEMRVGKAPDDQIAVELDRSVDSIRKRRNRLQIPKFRPMPSPE